MPRTEHTTRLLLLACTAVWLACAIRPLDFETWLLEQVAPLLGIGVLLWLSRHVRFSTLSKLGLALLFCAHTVGTHFTYSLTPYDEAWRALFGFSIDNQLGWERNNYDRAVHFLYGLCLAVPLEEAIRQRLATTSTAARFLGLNLILSTSAIYELIEWFAAVVFGGGTGVAYLGTQGDVWDAQADIGIAGVACSLVYGFSYLSTFLKGKWAARDGTRPDSPDLIDDSVDSATPSVDSRSELPTLPTDKQLTAIRGQRIAIHPSIDRRNT